MLPDQALLDLHIGAKEGVEDLLHFEEVGSTVEIAIVEG